MRKAILLLLSALLAVPVVAGGRKKERLEKNQPAGCILAIGNNAGPGNRDWSNHGRTATAEGTIATETARFSTGAQAVFNTNSLTWPTFANNLLNMSVFCWFNTELKDAMLCGNIPDASGTYPGWLWYTGSADGKVYLYFIESGTKYVGKYSSSVYYQIPRNLTNWGVGFVKSGNGAAAITMYSQGATEGVQSSGGTLSSYATTNNIYAGRAHPPDASRLYGALDELQIYNRALSDQEMKSLYCRGRANQFHERFSRRIALSTVWTNGPHAGFPLIEYWNNSLVVVLREGTSHTSTNGMTRVLRSDDLGGTWTSAALWTNGVYERSANCMSIDSTNTLRVNVVDTSTWVASNITNFLYTCNEAGATNWSGPTLQTGVNGCYLWSELDVAGVTYVAGYYTDGAYTSKLWSASDGVTFSEVSPIATNPVTDEVATWFDGDGYMNAHMRYDLAVGGSQNVGLWARAAPPYTTWSDAIPCELMQGQHYVTDGFRQYLIGRDNDYAAADGSDWGLYRIEANGYLRLIYRQLGTTGAGHDGGYADAVVVNGRMYVVYYDGTYTDSHVYLAILE